MRVVRRISLIAMVLTLFAAVATLGLHSQQRAAAAPVPNNARVIAERWRNSRTLDLTVTSPSIDAFTKTVRLLVPEGWSKNSTKTYPTLWMLHGGMGNHNDWSGNTDIAALTAKRDVIVVMPETSWCSAYSDWWNYGKGGSPAWETYITKELPAILQNTYRANETRTVAGLSMGGQGALKLAVTNPGFYKGAASFSGNVDPLHSYNNTADGPDLPGLSCLADWKRVWGDYRIPEQKAIWQRQSPYDQADKLATLNYLYVSSGDGLSNPLKVGTATTDSVEQQVNTENQALAAKLQSLGVPATTHFYAGTHSWPYWQEEMHRALPGLLQVMGVPEVQQ